MYIVQVLLLLLLWLQGLFLQLGLVQQRLWLVVGVMMRVLLLGLVRARHELAMEPILWRPLL